MDEKGPVLPAPLFSRPITEAAPPRSLRAAAVGHQNLDPSYRAGDSSFGDVAWAKEHINCFDK
jgi:hypothetical protein